MLDKQQMHDKIVEQPYIEGERRSKLGDEVIAGWLLQMKVYSGLGIY